MRFYFIFYFSKNNKHVNSLFPNSKSFCFNETFPRFPTHQLVKNYACFKPPPMRKKTANPLQLAVHRNPLQLVQREIAILKKLSHPNVVKLVEVGGPDLFNQFMRGSVTKYRNFSQNCQMSFANIDATFQKI